MKKRLLSIITLIMVVSLKAQEMPEIVPPSPEASAMANFTEVPVSHYTGLPNISVPIYTIKQKGIEIPIQLSYHARGVQVTEIAPRTGTGWSLLYGGSISRQMRGRNDERQYIGNTDFMNFSSSLNLRNAIITNNCDSDYDFYPDQFTFNAGGVSGKFILDYVDGKPLIQSYGDITITYTTESSYGIDAFVMKDSKGNTYYFGKSKYGQRTARDYQQSVGYSVDFTGNENLDPITNNSDQYYSAWKLMDIETVYGELISFYYEMDSEAVVYWKKTLDKHMPPPSETGAGQSNGLGNMSDITKIITRVSRIQNYEHQISKIEFNNGRDRIEFIEEADDREDFVGHALDKIEIYHKDQLVKGYDLDYEYTESTDTSSMLSHFIYGDFSMYFKRLFLKNVTQYGKDNSTLPPYEFTYDPQVLPSHFSSRQDYWGYYNGAENNGPFTRLFEYGNYVPDRRVDTLKSEAGILKEIKYPTGGTSKFTYEHNKGDLPLSFFNRLELPEINPASQDEVEIVLTKADFLNEQGFMNPYTMDFPPRASATVEFNCSDNDFLHEGQDPLPCIFYFSINGAPVNYGENSVYELGEEITFHSGVNGDSLNISAFPINGINPPDLYLDPDYDFTITIKYDTPDTGSLYAAGKRIKRIETIDEQGQTLIKEYDYVYPSALYENITGGTNSPSGSIKSLPAFLNKVGEGYDAEFATHTGYYDASSAYSSFQANSIGYSGVIEYHGTKANNIGKTEYSFTNFNDTGGDYFEFPYHPPTDNEWLRGKPVGIFHFRNDGANNYTLIKETHNKYRYGDRIYMPDFDVPFGAGGFEFSDDLPEEEQFVFTPRGMQYDWEDNSSWSNVNTNTHFKLQMFMPNVISVSTYQQGGFAGCDPMGYYSYRTYHFTGGTLNLDHTKEKVYNDNGTIETTTTYGYDYDNHYQPASITTVTSDEKPVVQTITYAQNMLSSTYVESNYTTPSTIADQLNNQHRIVPIVTKTHKDENNNDQLETNELISTSKTEYDWFSTDEQDVLEPKHILTAKSNDALEERLNYHKYDKNGNIIEVSKKDGTHVVYIWGYDETLPIAKIENITFAELPSTAAYAQLLSNGDNDSVSEDTLRQALNDLRVALPSSLVTTFTYNPLIGVTSITDPRGQVVYYEYDEFNRLKQVKDQDGNILSENEYHYQTQN